MSLRLVVLALLVSVALVACVDKGVVKEDSGAVEGKNAVCFPGSPDEDQDGTCDAEDQCPGVPGSRGANGCPPCTGSAVFYSILFRSGSAVFDQSAQSVVDENASLLRRYTNFSVVIQGHADSVGAKDRNMALSKARAMAVYRALIQQGVEPRRLSVEWVGESNPLEKESGRGSERNRRVEIFMVSPP